MFGLWPDACGGRTKLRRAGLVSNAPGGFRFCHRHGHGDQPAEKGRHRQGRHGCAHRAGRHASQHRRASSPGRRDSFVPRSQTGRESLGADSGGTVCLETSKRCPSRSPGAAVRRCARSSRHWRNYKSNGARTDQVPCALSQRSKPRRGRRGTARGADSLSRPCRSRRWRRPSGRRLLMSEGKTSPVDSVHRSDPTTPT